MDGKDVVAMARTGELIFTLWRRQLGLTLSTLGSGKTAAFLIPMFERLKTHSAKVSCTNCHVQPDYAVLVPAPDWFSGPHFIPYKRACCTNYEVHKRGMYYVSLSWYVSLVHSLLALSWYVSLVHSLLALSWYVSLVHSLLALSWYVSLVHSLLALSWYVSLVHSLLALSWYVSLVHSLLALSCEAQVLTNVAVLSALLLSLASSPTSEQLLSSEETGTYMPYGR